MGAQVAIDPPGLRSKRLTSNKDADLSDRQAGGMRRRPQDDEGAIVPNRQRGCVHTSTRAGWPDLTTSTARLSAGPSSAGSLIGPALQ